MIKNKFNNKLILIVLCILIIFIILKHNYNKICKKVDYTKTVKYLNTNFIIKFLFSNKLISKLCQFYTYNNFVYENKNILNKVKEYDFVIDIGANVGALGLLIIKKSKCKLYYGFEPNLNNYIALKENFEINKKHLSNTKYNLINMGVSKEKRIMVYDDNSTQTTLENFKNKIEVNTLDNLIKINYQPNRTFIKIDVEGMELDVLIGMKDIINKYKPDIVLEINPISWSLFLGQKNDKSKILSILDEYHYNIEKISIKDYFCKPKF
jgi:FkbM family methyltransferase